MTDKMKLSLLAALSISLTPALAFAQTSVIAPDPGTNLPIGVLTFDAGQTVSAERVGNVVVVTNTSGTASILDLNGNHLADCEDNLKECLDLANDGDGGGGGNDPADPADPGDGGKKKKKGGKKNNSTARTASVSSVSEAKTVDPAAQGDRMARPMAEMRDTAKMAKRQRRMMRRR